MSPCRPGPQIFNFTVNDTARIPHWSLVTNLTAVDASDYDQFGTAVSTDGTYVAIGAPYHGRGNKAQAGEVYVYVNGFWSASHAAVISSPNPAIADYFGSSVAVYQCVTAVAPVCAVKPAVLVCLCVAVFHLVSV